MLGTTAVLSTEAAGAGTTQPAGLTPDVTVKELTVSGLTAAPASRVYDGTTVIGISGTAALLSGEAAGAGATSDGKPYTVDTLSLTGMATGAFADRNVSTAKAITVSGLSLGGADNANYTLAAIGSLTAASQFCGFTSKVTINVRIFGSFVMTDMVFSFLGFNHFSAAGCLKRSMRDKTSDRRAVS